MPNSQSDYSEYRQSILIADDDPTILEIVSEGFEHYGFIVFKAKDGFEAWNLFQRESINNVLTDICMPILDGIELSHRIRKSSASTKIALMTGDAFESGKELLEKGIVDNFFMKPFDLNSACNYFLQYGQMV